VITKIAGSRTGGLIGLLHAYPLVAATFEIVLPGEAISSAVSGVNIPASGSATRSSSQNPA
jgi:hypothetical protein